MAQFLDQARSELERIYNTLGRNASSAIMVGLDRSETANIKQETTNAAKRRVSARNELSEELARKQSQYNQQISSSREDLRRLQNDPPESAYVDYRTGRSKDTSMTSQPWWPGHYQKRIADWEQEQETIQAQIDDMQAAAKTFDSDSRKSLLQAWDNAADNMMQSIPSAVGPNINPQAVAAAEARSQEIADRSLGRDYRLNDIRTPEGEDMTTPRGSRWPGGTIQRPPGAEVSPYYPSSRRDISNLTPEQIVEMYGFEQNVPTANTSGRFGGGNQPGAADPFLELGTGRGPGGMNPGGGRDFFPDWLKDLLFTPPDAAIPPQTDISDNIEVSIPTPVTPDYRAGSAVSDPTGVLDPDSPLLNPSSTRWRTDAYEEPTTIWATDEDREPTQYELDMEKGTEGNRPIKLDPKGDYVKVIDERGDAQRRRDEEIRKKKEKEEEEAGESAARKQYQAALKAMTDSLKDPESSSFGEGYAYPDVSDLQDHSLFSLEAQIASINQVFDTLNRGHSELIAQGFTERGLELEEEKLQETISKAASQVLQAQEEIRIAELNLANKNREIELEAARATEQGRQFNADLQRQRDQFADELKQAQQQFELERQQLENSNNLAEQEFGLKQQQFETDVIDRNRRYELDIFQADQAAAQADRQFQLDQQRFGLQQYQTEADVADRDRSFQLQKYISEADVADRQRQFGLEQQLGLGALGLQEQQFGLEQQRFGLEEYLGQSQIEQRKLEADRDFEVARQRLDLDVANAQQSGRQVDQRLVFDYQQAAQRAQEVNQQLQLQQYETELSQPYNVAVRNLLGGGASPIGTTPTTAAMTGLQSLYGGMPQGQTQPANPFANIGIPAGTPLAGTGTTATAPAAPTTTGTAPMTTGTAPTATAPQTGAASQLFFNAMPNLPGMPASFGQGTVAPSMPTQGDLDSALAAIQYQSGNQDINSPAFRSMATQLAGQTNNPILKAAYNALAQGISSASMMPQTAGMPMSQAIPTPTAVDPAAIMDALPGLKKLGFDPTVSGGWGTPTDFSKFFPESGIPTFPAFQQLQEREQKVATEAGLASANTMADMAKTMAGVTPTTAAMGQKKRRVIPGIGEDIRRRYGD